MCAILITAPRGGGNKPKVRRASHQMSNVENVSTKGTKRAPQSRPADLIGRPWARQSEVKVGDYLETDAGFTCVDAGSVLQVRESEGRLYIPCRCGQHSLEGQLGYTRATKGAYVGLYPAATPSKS